MTVQLLAATTGPDLSTLIGLAVLAWIGWHLLAIWWFPYAPCGRCKGTGKHRSGRYWRPCRRCTGTGRKVRLGRRVWNWSRDRS